MSDFKGAFEDFIKRLAEEGLIRISLVIPNCLKIEDELPHPDSDDYNLYYEDKHLNVLAKFPDENFQLFQEFEFKDYKGQKYKAKVEVEVDFLI